MKKIANSMLKKKSKISVLNIVGLVLTVLMHVAIITLVILAHQYFNLELKTFICLFVCVVCLIAVADILFYAGLKYKDIAPKIINIVLALLLTIIGTGGSYYVSKLNSSVDNIIENTGTDQYETINGTFVYYTPNTTTAYTSLEDLKNVSNIKVGIIYDDGAGVGSTAKTLLAEAGVDAEYTTFYSNEDLLGALLGNSGDDNVDIAVFPSSYRQRWQSEEDMDYDQYLDDMVDFYSFEDKVKTGENENANKDLYTEPFNILLIGFAPEDEAMTTGLADTIIVATVNPQTFTVSLTSIARDTYTTLACNPSGERQKINAARGISRQCLMDTVGEFLDIDIDYYMEVNFLGVVQIVDAIGGIVVNNPVTFVGQSASGIRGDYTVLVPAGEEVVCDGEMALAFARERHAMPNGDFDRQQHQQEVIAAIAEKLLSMKDVNQALAVMEAAGNNMSTNLSLNQLTGIFNYLVNHKNTTGMSTFNMVNIKNMRVTGYASWYYSYSMRLPQWIYKAYQGSIQEAKDLINDVMNNYSTSDIKQLSFMKFFAEAPYTRGQLYSDYFDEEEVHEEMPAFYDNLIGDTYESALAWASENGVSLSVTFIDESSESYDASLAGTVTSQYPRQGALVSEYPSGSITVMGNVDPDKEYTVSGCDDVASCKAFASKYGITVSEEYQYYTNNEHTSGEFAGASVNNGGTIKKSDTLVIYTWKEKSKVTVPSYEAGYNLDMYVSQLKLLGINYTTTTTNNGATEANNGTIASVSPTGEVYAGDTVTITLYQYQQHEHSWQEINRTDATCDSAGSVTYKCSSCGQEKTEEIPQLSGDSCSTSGGENTAQAQ